MLKKTITYTDFNDEEVTEDHYFHLSKAELVELEMSEKGGLSEALKEIIASEDGKAIISQFKGIILGAYGKRSPDGRRFTKNQQIRDEFESTEAYSTLFMELVTNTESAIEFVNGVVPAGVAEEAAAAVQKSAISPILSEVPEPVPEETSEVRTLTRVEFDNLTTEEVVTLGPEIAAGKVKLVDE